MSGFFNGTSSGPSAISDVTGLQTALDDKALKRQWITASPSATQTQGNGAVIFDAGVENVLVHIETVTTSGDAVTLDGVAEGIELLVLNDGANPITLWPASGDDLGAGVDTSVTLAAGGTLARVGKNATTWGAWIPAGGVQYAAGGGTENVLQVPDGNGGLEDTSLSFSSGYGIICPNSQRTLISVRTDAVKNWKLSQAIQSHMRGMVVQGQGGNGLMFSDNAFDPDTGYYASLHKRGLGWGVGYSNQIYPPAKGEFRENDGRPQLCLSFDGDSGYLANCDDSEVLTWSLKSGATDAHWDFVGNPRFDVSSTFTLHGGVSNNQLIVKLSAGQRPEIYANQDYMTLMGTPFSDPYGINYPDTNNGMFLRHSRTVTFTASTTQTQGNGALSTNFTRITTANSGDVVTLPRLHSSASVGGVQGGLVVISNSTGNSCTVWCRSGESIDGVTDANFALAGAETALLASVADGVWIRLV